MIRDPRVLSSCEDAASSPRRWPNVVFKLGEDPHFLIGRAVSVVARWHVNEAAGPHALCGHPLNPPQNRGFASFCC
jgi:hypothetical protein